jgi:hypothetical protein
MYCLIKMSVEPLSIIMCASFNINYCITKATGSTYAEQRVNIGLGNVYVEELPVYNQPNG